MPTYEYRCKACGEHLEVVQSFKDDALTTCPACGQQQLRKVFGNIGIAFKGSGFYKTDSRAKTSATSSSSTSSSSDSSSKGASTSTDAGSSSSSGSTSTPSSTTPSAAAS